MSSPSPDATIRLGRPFAGVADLRAMGACLARSWNHARPLVNTTPGDLEWWYASGEPGTDWTSRVQLWADGDEVLGYGWLSPPGEFDWHQRHDLPDATRAALADATIAWAAAAARRLAVEAGSEPPATLETWAMDADAWLVDALRSRGWTPADAPAYTHFYRRLDGVLDALPPLPAGYRLRRVRLPDDLAARVEVHRAAFAPSRMTIDKYRTLATLSRYAPDHDLVVEAPDGTFAAFTMVWWIPDARTGEFEPVGTHPAHQRRGLARTINLAGLHLLRDLGALDAIVFSATRNAASEALYRSVGFEPVTHHRAWTRPAG
jgi:ribosomal protein S18 acetylase RimI-like enzyme